MLAQTLGYWVRKARQGKPGSVGGSVRLVGDLEAENARLKQEVVRLKLEKEVLKKAGAYFGKESL